MALQTPRRKAWIALGLIAGLVAIVAGAWGLHEWAPLAHPAPGDDIEWPANIEPLADFVEEHTGLLFLAPVRIEFIPNGTEYQARVNAGSEATDRGRELAATDTAVGRALGYWSGDVSLADDSQALRNAADFGSRWLPDEHTIVVRADDGKSQLSPLDRAELVVLLTEVIDDQHFHVAQRLDDAPDAQTYQALLGLDLGQALWVRDRYVDDFDADDSDEYLTALDDSGSTFVDAVGHVSPAFRALRTVAQNLGPAFVAALHEGDGDAVDRAFATDTPTALDQVSLPAGKYERRDPVEPVAAPPVPSRGTWLYDRQLGPFGLYLVLAGGVDATEALTASDGWGNDAFTAYRLDGRVCVDGRIVADSRDDAERIDRALGAWAAARPDESDALVGRDGTTLLLTVCDPGADVEEHVVTQLDIDQYFGRADLLADRIDLTGNPALAECVAVTFFRTFTAADLHGFEIDVVGELESMTDECADSV